MADLDGDLLLAPFKTGVTNCGITDMVQRAGTPVEIYWD